MDITTFLINNSLVHLSQRMVDQGVTLDILLEATDNELYILVEKIADKIKLRVALDKLRNKRTSDHPPDESVLVAEESKSHNNNTTFMLQQSPIVQQQPKVHFDNTLEKQILPNDCGTVVTLFSKNNIPQVAEQRTVSELNKVDALSSFDLKALGSESAGKSLHQLLSSISVGKVLLTKADNGEQLNSHDRALLVKIIVETELNNLDENNKSIRKNVWQQWTKEVTQIFKHETPEIYYVPYRVIDGRVIQASGLFHNRLITHRRYLNSISYRKKRSISPSCSDSSDAGSSKSPESRKRVRPLPVHFNLLKLENESSELSSLEWLKGSSSPEDILIEKWNATLKLRQEQLSKSISYREYFVTFPALKLPNGYKLLSYDFAAVNPTATSTFDKNFPIVKSNLLKLLANKSDMVKPDQTTFDLLKLASEGEEQANLAAFLAIPFLMRQMPTINVPRKKLWKLSREEVRSAFIARVTTAADIERFCADREALVVARGIPEQPYIIAVGACWSTVTQYEIVVHRGLRYQLPNICGAIKTTFEIYWALDCAYSKDSAPCWMFIQRAIYNMKSKFDVEGVPLRELLNKMKP